MKIVLQRVLSSSVAIAGEEVAKIGRGMLILLGIEDGDDAEKVEWACGKLARLRIFEDEQGLMNLDINQVEGSFLVVSQFTLLGSVKKGNRPSFVAAARPEVAIPIYEMFLKRLGEVSGRQVEHGVFGADMKVSLVNDGPVTLIIDVP